ncbi:unnamed protein product [Protopolystoma xenopodis]|uniref:Uncharacterized protein n=1 Tax=Protopolystoma xenopodis TaxID=117903 RepID=A0A3S5BMM2_9PLAT|nr:unnamed protein product [Protopolystoma xenopodis]
MQRQWRQFMLEYLSFLSKTRVEGIHKLDPPEAVGDYLGVVVVDLCEYVLGAPPCDADQFLMTLSRSCSESSRSHPVNVCYSAEKKVHQPAKVIDALSARRSRLLSRRSARRGPCNAHARGRKDPSEIREARAYRATVSPREVGQKCSKYEMQSCFARSRDNNVMTWRTLASQLTT